MKEIYDKDIPDLKNRFEKFIRTKTRYDFFFNATETGGGKRKRKKKLLS